MWASQKQLTHAVHLQIRSGEHVNNYEITKFAQLFNDELTLDKSGAHPSGQPLPLCGHLALRHGQLPGHPLARPPLSHQGADFPQALLPPAPSVSLPFLDELHPSVSALYLPLEQNTAGVRAISVLHFELEGALSARGGGGGGGGG